ncbi:EpsG family protein [Heliobacterium chlorum]|uniref:EpsG family protein n=1 Tax=Heliobacterium chlorum TaxID=2698 RepID=A0ABR7T7Z9_HELCL|nr:EpsG family protein [Heliobacterium chlorum]MBC9785831.1 EpsG family protein [Heliobacterium chlorum]
MTVYLLNVGLLMIWSVLILNNRVLTFGKKLFVILASLQWIIISGLRDITVGGRDIYISYYNSFNRVLTTSWTEIADRFINILFYGAEGKDPGYMFIEKTISLMTDSYQVYLAIIAALFMVPFGVFIYRNSRDPFISFLIYSTLFYAFYSLTGLRQTIATALVVLIGYELIKKKKLLWFMVVTLIAYTIHKSVVVFTPFYFLADKEISIKYTLTLLAISTTSLVLGNQLFFSLFSSFGYGDYVANDIGGTGTFTFMLLLVTIAALLKKKKIINNNPQAVHFLNATLLALFFSIMTLENQSFMRVQQYYSIFIVLLIPEIIKSFERWDKVIVYTGSVVVLLALFIKNNPEYIFFWQGVN